MKHVTDCRYEFVDIKKKTKRVLIWFVNFYLDAFLYKKDRSSMDVNTIYRGQVLLYLRNCNNRHDNAVAADPTRKQLCKVIYKSIEKRS